MSSSAQPPPPNPVTTGYEQFTNDTPLVTRYILTGLGVTWLLSFFVDVTGATATSVQHCVMKFQLYRLVTAPFTCSSLLSLVFAFISFLDSGKRLEFSMGSTAFLWYILTIGVGTTVTFLVVMLILYGLTGSLFFLLGQAEGVWTILFGLIATECCKAPRDSKRRLFVVTIPTIYYPLALWGLFALFGGLDPADLISVGIGYAYGYGYLDKLKLSQSRFNQWEDSVLANFTQRQGWVVGHSATGSEAWDANSNNNNNTGFNFFSSQQQQPSAPSEAAASPQQPTFPTTGGRSLGSASRRPVTDARAAMLAAAERRANQQDDVNNKV